jgi:hypothetical protein
MYVHGLQHSAIPRKGFNWLGRQSADSGSIFCPISFQSAAELKTKINAKNGGFCDAKNGVSQPPFKRIIVDCFWSKSRTGLEFSFPQRFSYYNTCMYSFCVSHTELASKS